LPRLFSLAVLDFVSHVGKAVQEQLADIGQDGGIAHREAIRSQEHEQLPEGTVDVIGGLELAGEGGELVGDAAGVKKVPLLIGVERTKGRMFAVAEHTALMAASVCEEAALGFYGWCWLYWVLSFRFHGILGTWIWKKSERIGEYPPVFSETI
jgi:hypothetical protein